MRKSKKTKPKKQTKTRKVRNSKAALKREIRSLVDEVNERMFEYENLTESNADINPIFIDMFTDLFTKGMSGVRMSSFGMRITPAFYTRINGKFKGYDELVIQRNELKDFLEMDIYSPSAKKDYDAITEAKYQTFIANTGMDEDKFTRTEWEAMFDAFEILHERSREFSYGDRQANSNNRDAADAYRNTYMNLDRQQRRTFGDVLQESLQHLKDNGDVITYETIIDEVEGRFGLNR